MGNTTTSTPGGSVDGANLVVREELSGAGAHINEAAAQLADMLSRLTALLEPLEGTWTGSAATYFEGLRAEWNYAANGLFGPEGVLGQIAQAMNVSWGNYVSAEEANTTTWNH
jgi:WXG100 family type VII secretion target